MSRGASSRNRPGRASQREGGFALLIGAAALILQLILSPLHAPLVHSSSTSTQLLALEALAELAALTGDQNVFCADMDGGQQGSVPAHEKADCPGLCCHLSHGPALFLAPPAPLPKVFSGVSVRISRAHAILLAVSASPTNAQPRGPPLSA
ncbi:MAG: hypothetical protein JO172_12555 [Hyphomicrobiales bacterium]|nr:hypothetical protein [Hyphomicrobiales bacterium]